MKIITVKTYEDASRVAADIFAAQIKEKPNSVLGLATGSTPLGLYGNLIDMYKAGELDFSAITSVNLDEYYPLAPDHPQSYRYFMNENLFKHVNIDMAKTFVPDGMAKDTDAFCAAYDEKIAALGGIDLQLLGIGENGHIAFNEPDTALVAGTHITDLTESTIHANSRFFESEADVPRKAMTMGMGSILKARKIVLIATGKNKYNAVHALADNDLLRCDSPATLLKVHPDVTVICDEAAMNG